MKILEQEFLHGLDFIFVKLILSHTFSTNNCVKTFVKTCDEPDPYNQVLIQTSYGKFTVQFIGKEGRENTIENGTTTSQIVKALFSMQF